MPNWTRFLHYGACESYAATSVGRLNGTLSRSQAALCAISSHFLEWILRYQRKKMYQPSPTQHWSFCILRRHKRASRLAPDWAKAAVKNVCCLSRDEEASTNLTRAPLGCFYNAPHLGAISSLPPSDLRNYQTDFKNSSGIWKPWKNCDVETNFNDLGVTSDVTGQFKVKNIRLFGLGDIGEQNFDVKLKQSQRIGMDSVSDICKYHFLCFVTII